MSSMHRTVSRRGFMQQGAALTTAVTAFNVLPGRDARAQEPIRVGVVGCGGRGRGAMVDSLRAASNVEIVALADIFPEKFEAAKQELAKMEHTTDVDCFLGFRSYREVMQTDCDYVILATPPCYRPESLEAAVAAGKHVFMEKPAAVDAPGIRRIVEAGETARALGLSIVAGTQRRHQANYVETIRRIHDGAIGEITNAQTFWCGGPIGFPDRDPAWSEVEWQIRGWYHWMWLSGDHILEQHVHNLDVINWIMDSHPVKAYGTGGRSWQERGNIWDHHAVHFQYPNGVDVLSMCSQHPRTDHRVEERVQGTRGRSNCKNWISSDGENWDYTDSFTNAYIQEHTNLINSIRSGKPINEARNVAYSTMTAVMGRTAEYTGSEVSWDDVYNQNESFPVHYELADIEPMDVPIPGGKKYTGEEGWKPG